MASFAVGTAAHVVAPAAATACSSSPPAVEIEVESVPATPEGVFVVKATLFDVLLEDVVVRDASDMVAPGQFSTVLLRTRESTGLEYPEILIVWRAEAGLEPGATYEAEVRHSDPEVSPPARFTVITSDEPYAGFSHGSEILELQATRVRRRVEYCDGFGSDCGCESSYPAYTEVRAALPAATGDRSAAFQLVPADGIEPARSWTAWDAEGQNEPKFDLDDRASVYCATLRVMNLHDGHVLESAPRCVADSGEPDPPDPGASDPPMDGGSDAGGEPSIDGGAAPDAASVQEPVPERDLGTADGEAGTLADAPVRPDGGAAGERGGSGCAVGLRGPPGSSAAGAEALLLFVVALWLGRRPNG